MSVKEKKKPLTASEKRALANKKANESREAVGLPMAKMKMPWEEDAERKQNAEAAREAQLERDKNRIVNQPAPKTQEKIDEEKAYQDRWEKAKAANKIENERLAELGRQNSKNYVPLSEKELIDAMKNWDNVQNEGYQDGYNPYRDELQSRANKTSAPYPSAKMNADVEYDQWGEPINMRG